MYTEEKKRNTNYGSIFMFSFCCFVFVIEFVRFTKPYYNLNQNIAATVDSSVATAEEYYAETSGSELVPCHFLRLGSVFARKHHHKLSTPIAQWRERPPTTYCVKFESFATMMKLVKDGKYESRPFTSGGYNWTFLIYPNGNKKDNINGYVSVYAKIDNSSLIEDPKDVYAEIKFFVYNRIQDKYYTYQETEARRFHLFKPEWGVPTFQPTAVFTNPGHGFIFDGEQCVFGIDVFVAQSFKKWEVFSYDENVRDPIYDWKLTKFSTLDRDFYTSEPFSSGGRNWVLKVYPNGFGAATGNSLSLYLLSESNEKGYVRAKLRVLDQIRSNHVEKQVEGWPNAAENGWGYQKFIPLADLKDASKGFVVDDNLKIEVEIVAFSKTDSI